jgi:hypothetical protein
MDFRERKKRICALNPKGECVTCPAGRYGPNCAAKCACLEAGTALCSHLTGECFCRQEGMAQLLKLSEPSLLGTRLNYQNNINFLKFCLLLVALPCSC